MAYNYGNTNNNNNKKSVNTSGLQCRNAYCDSPSALIVVYWDDMIRLSFAPELPESERSTSRRYDYEHAVNTTIVRSKCNELINGYKSIIVPALKEKIDAAISVPVANVNAIQIATNIVNGEPHPCIRLIQNISEDTLIADTSNVSTYEFNKGEIIKDYDYNTGKFDSKIVTFNELDLFMHDLENARNASSNAYIHCDRVVNRYWKDTLDSKINRIGEKNGLDFSNRQYSGNGGGGQGTIFDNRTSSTPSSNAAPTSVITSLDELDNEF